MEEILVRTLSELASQPTLVYLLVFGAMYASSFGLPIPEEITLLTLGFLAHLAMFPENYAVTSVEESRINVHTAAAVAFVAVVSSDCLVFLLGRTVGPRVLSFRPVKKVLTPQRMAEVEKWTSRYGAWAGGIFRFTPGIRFPGHLTCGMLKVSTPKFLLIDGFAALISVPTQIYLVGFYGREIISMIKTYQPIFVMFICIAVLFFFRKKIFSLLQSRKQIS